MDSDSVRQLRSSHRPSGRGESPRRVSPFNTGDSRRLSRQLGVFAPGLRPIGAALVSRTDPAPSQEISCDRNSGRESLSTISSGRVRMTSSRDQVLVPETRSTPSREAHTCNALERAESVTVPDAVLQTAMPNSMRAGHLLSARRVQERDAPAGRASRDGGGAPWRGARALGCA